MRKPIVAGAFVSGAFLLCSTVLAQDATAPTGAEETDSDPLVISPAPQFDDIDGLSGEPLKMSLRDVVFSTLSRNLDVQIERVDQQISSDRLLGTYGIYDPVLGASTTFTRTDQQTGTFGVNADGSPSNTQVPTYQDQLDSRVSISQLIGTGATVEVFVQETQTDNRTTPLSFGPIVEPQYNETVGINVTQPLLKNFGPLVTNANIRIAKRQQQQSDEDFRGEIHNRVSDVMKAYWDLDFALRNLDVQRQALASAEELERVNSKKVEVGSLPRLSLYQAEAQVASRESFVVEAEAQVLNAQDRILTLIDWEDTGDFISWNRPIQTSDIPAYDETLDLDDSYLVEVALKFRPDYRALQLNREVAEINRDVAKRQRLPELNALAGYNLNGLEDDRDDAFTTVGQREYEGYFVGLEFRYPLFNRAARAEFQEAERSLERSDLSISASELGIRQQVRAASRDLRTAIKQINATTRQVRADIEKLEAEQKRLNVGERTVFDVLDFQDDLAESRANQARALADYQIALIELGRVTGVLVELMGVQFTPSEVSDGYDQLLESIESDDDPYQVNLKGWQQTIRELPYEDIKKD